MLLLLVVPILAYIMVQAVVSPMLQPLLRMSRSSMEDRWRVPTAPLVLPQSSPVLYHSSTMNSLLLERACLDSSTLLCMLTRLLSLISQAGQTLDATPMGSQLPEGGTLSLDLDCQSFPRSRQLLVYKH